MKRKNTVILNDIYPVVKKSMDKNYNKYKQVLSRFFEKRSKSLYDTCPCDRIFFGQDDLDDFYRAMGFTEKDIKNLLKNVYYYNIAKFNPRAAKDEFTIVNMMIIRYFYLKKDTKNCELASLYLAFSGKFYPSIHSGSFPKVQPSEYRYVMEYVVNNKLTNKFDLKTEKNVIGSIRSKCKTWLDTYKDKFEDCDDEDVVYLIQQLHNRIKSFMKNIAELYYEVYDNKDAYLVYDSDSLDDDNYHLADNDSLKIERAVEKTMNNLNSKSIDYKSCKMVADANVKTDELKNIIESILSDSNNLPEVKELIRLIITLYFVESKDKNLNNISFVSRSIVPKPNSKDPNVLKQKYLVEKLLTENSSAYNRRKSREATKSSYQKSLLSYFVLAIYNSNK